MTADEIKDILEEFHLVRPEVLAPKARKLFEAIMCIADERDELKAQLKGTTHCYDEEEHRKLQENYDRIYDENCKLREEHNINDVSLLDENYRLKKGIYRIYDYLEDKYGCSAVKVIINDTDVDELYEILDEVLK